MARKGLTTRAEDYSRWYQEVIAAADMAEHAPVRGCMIIKPWGYGIWERVQRAFDDEIKATGHENAYFPMFIPKEMIQKEADHIEGFAPECAVVTHGGNKELEEPLFVRPTSEAIICSTYAKWVESWRDLPIMINQWANVVRWEMRPRLFLRTLEFLWQEGHTAHETQEEAQAEVMTMLDVYARIVEDVMAIPVIKGRKSAAERFPGADETYTIEAMMQDGRALQSGTSHDLGQTFAKTYGIEFQDREGNNQFAWSTSWGVSTRLIGGLIMTHADDKGMVVPPKLAQQQVVLVPIYKGEEQGAEVIPAAAKIVDDIKALGIRAKLDDRDNLRPGPKFFEWEKKGVPVRLEFGKRDMDGGKIVVVRRDTGDKTPMDIADAVAGMPALLGTIQADLFAKAQKLRDERTYVCDDYEDFKARVADGGFFLMRCSGPEAEAKIKEDTKATHRCVPLDAEPDPGPCVVTGEHCEGPRAIFARSY